MTFASQASFAQKILNFQFQLVQPFEGSNVINVSGLRSRVRISQAAAVGNTTADASIFGLSQSLMNKLTTSVIVNRVTRNSGIISAGVNPGKGASTAAAANVNSVMGFPVVFGGTIWLATGDYNNMPDVPLRLSAQLGLIDAVVSATPSSFTGSTSIESIMQGFARKLTAPNGQPVAFENNNVSGNLDRPYFPGTIMQQVYQAAYHARINAQLVDGGTKLAIWPQGGSRTSQTSIPLISPDTGMIGYPTFASGALMIVKMVYNPDVIYGGQIQVQSDIPQANGKWTVWELDLALDSLSPGGEWSGTAQCYPTGLAPPVPGATR